jgi:hypothetical protein
MQRTFTTRKKIKCLRWFCVHCGASGWSSDGRTPAHDRWAGGSCRKSGQVSESQIKARLNREITKLAALATEHCDRIKADRARPAWWDVCE